MCAKRPSPSTALASKAPSRPEVQAAYLLRRSAGEYTEAVEQYDWAGKLGSKGNDPAYKELDIMVWITLLSSAIPFHIHV